MKSKNSSPSIIRDVVAVAGLYRSVFWMLGQQLRRGPDWQQHLYEESLRLREPAEERELAGARRN